MSARVRIVRAGHGHLLLAGGVVQGYVAPRRDRFRHRYRSSMGTASRVRQPARRGHRRGHDAPAAGPRGAGPCDARSRAARPRRCDPRCTTRPIRSRSGTGSRRIRWPTDPDAFDRRLTEVAGPVRVDRPPAAHLAVAAPRRAGRPRRSAGGERVPGHGRGLPDGHDRPGAGPRRIAPRPGSAGDASSGSLRARRRRVADGRSATSSRSCATPSRVEAARRPGVQRETAASLGEPRVHPLPGADRRRARRRRPAGHVRRGELPVLDRDGGLGTRAWPRRAGHAGRGRGRGGSRQRVDYLGVFADNEGAIRLYRRAGFVMVGDPAPDLLLLG